MKKILTAEAAKSAHPASQPATGMTGATNRNRFSNMLNYFETDVVGNPAAVLDSLGSGRFMCRTDVTPFHPYLSASADAEVWRGTGDNRRVPALKDQGEVGLSPDNTWGPLRPRTGFVMQPHPAKAAAVTATRGVDIVTRNPEGHVATPYRNSHSARRMLRGDPEASDPKTCSHSVGVWKETKNETGCRPAASLADVDAGTHPAMSPVRNPHTALGRRGGRTLWLALLATLPLLPQTRYIYWRDWTLVVTEKPKPHRAKPTTLAKLAEVEALLVGTDMTLRQIAAKVGISVATIYRHL